ncbi:DNA-3-methyladenine glycosylase-like [Patiria miniata]|uniref:DNA-3-methyladenine glycosylase n=1 Tax=Patiria miniata TaxID=46514 RepID=A0A914B0E2_PATMI|nr:DNA-3-methyladenine glycosylase-like [Patiria miniata]XP_038069242.1 DNA-3-methyladenine glycosylase-like [Patiria miniata]XP_038069243.1 DNA-3-methyladenine glycosylase-like [Patiria miniata]XP_038069244.1 DNA-3-methyladenine glycosylase-like [Patiria miniata]
MPGPRKGHKRKHEGSASSDSGRSSGSNNSSTGTTSPYFSRAKAKVSKASKKNDARLPASFFDKPCEDLAKSLLGQRLVHVLSSGERLSGTIVETEAYLGSKDSASHSYEGRRSDRVKAMYMTPGTCYVYLIYGMYDCLNISSKGDGQAVLIRALEPKEGIPTMRKFRDKRRKNPTKELKTKDLCNGPGKLTEALQITKAEINQISLATSPALWAERGEGQIKEGDIIACPRIGVDYATPEWVKKPLRFYVRGDVCISKKDKEAEKAAEKAAGNS